MQYQRSAYNAQSNFIFTVREVPTPHNALVGVVEATICNGTQSITDFGIADVKSAGSNKPVDILQKARELAEHAVLQRQQIAQAAYSPQYSQSSNTASRHSFTAAQGSPMGKANGGGTKPASQKQKEMIEGKCREKGINPDDLSQELCQRSLNDLRGQDANIVIQHLVNN